MKPRIGRSEVIVFALTCLAVALAAATPAGAAVTVSSFTAQGQATRIVLTWTTASEVDNAGFNLLRSALEVGTYSRVNASLLPSRCLGCIAGESYSVDDTTVTIGLTYFYKLETVTSGGATELFGPVSAAAGNSSPTPTSTTPSNVTESPTPTLSPTPNATSTLPAVPSTRLAAPPFTTSPTPTQAPNSGAPAGRITPTPSTTVPPKPPTPPTPDTGSATPPDVVRDGTPTQLPDRRVIVHLPTMTRAPGRAASVAAQAGSAIDRAPGPLRSLLAATIVSAATLQALTLAMLFRLWWQGRSAE